MIQNAEYVRLRSCNDHAHPIQDDYVAMMEDAEKRLARGERQKRCPNCGYWRWPLSRAQIDRSGATP